MTVFVEERFLLVRQLLGHPIVLLSACSAGGTVAPYESPRRSGAAHRASHTESQQGSKHHDSNNNSDLFAHCNLLYGTPFTSSQANSADTDSSSDVPSSSASNDGLIAGKRAWLAKAAQAPLPRLPINVVLPLDVLTEESGLWYRQPHRACRCERSSPASYHCRGCRLHVVDASVGFTE